MTMKIFNFLCCYISSFDKFIHDVIGCSHQDSGSQTSQAVELRFSARQHPGTVWVNNSCNMYISTDNAFSGVALERDSTLLSKETASTRHLSMGILNFILVSKQVRNGTLYKGNVARGFIGCHVVSIMIMPVQYAFFGPVHTLPVAWGYTIRKIFSCYNVLPTVPKGTHSVESPSMVDPQWNILYWGSRWNLHSVCWGAVGCGWGTTSVHFGIIYVWFIPSWLPVFIVEPQYQHRDFLFLLKISFEGHIQNLQKFHVGLKFEWDS